MGRLSRLNPMAVAKRAGTAPVPERCTVVQFKGRPPNRHRQCTLPIFHRAKRHDWGPWVAIEEETPAVPTEETP